MFNDRYTNLLSYLDIYRSRNEMKLVHSIKRKLHRTSNIIRVTDKSRVFHVDSTIHYEEKVKQYQIKTNAYVELSSNPLLDTFNKVVRLLNDLRTKDKVAEWQYKKMLPKKDKIKLAYLYFIPKSHKVSSILFSFTIKILITTKQSSYSIF